VDKVFPDYYCLNFASRGALKWRIGRRRFLTLRAPVAWWTFPGPRFQYGSQDGTPWDHYFVCFRGPRVETFTGRGLLPLDTRHPWARIADPVGFCREFENVLGLWEDIAHMPQRRVHVLEGLLLQLVERPDVEGESPRDKSVRRLADEIRRLPSSPWDFAEEAREIGVSVPHFHRIFRGITRLPPWRFVIRARLEAAARLLHADSRPLKDIAEEVGCPDIYYFSRLFRRHFGIPPGRYRREAGQP
jgi:AraC-like DNA-binding protein